MSVQFEAIWTENATGRRMHRVAKKSFHTNLERKLFVLVQLLALRCFSHLKQIE